MVEVCIIRTIPCMSLIKFTIGLLQFKRSFGIWNMPLQIVKLFISKKDKKNLWGWLVYEENGHISITNIERSLAYWHSFSYKM